jgi:YD repeat-containing protein
VEAITDPGNKIRSFQYDPFSRLLNVGDNNNNVLTHNTYHYQGQ